MGIVAAVLAAATGDPWPAIVMMPGVFLLGYVVRDIEVR